MSKRIKDALDTIGFLAIALPAVVLAYPIAVLYAARYIALAYMRDHTAERARSDAGGTP